MLEHPERTEEMLSLYCDEGWVNRLFGNAIVFGRGKDTGEVLVCPECYNTNVHLEAISARIQDHEVILCGSRSGRGNGVLREGDGDKEPYVQIELWCENGHYGALQLLWSSGATVVNWDFYRTDPHRHD